MKLKKPLKNNARLTDETLLKRLRLYDDGHNYRKIAEMTNGGSRNISRQIRAVLKEEKVFGAST